MNRNYNDTEQIENYLRGKMSAGEAEAFESQLQTDPALASEFQMQQEIIDTIKKNRKAELKARLDNVHVGSYGSSLTSLKVAVAVAITAATGLGIYFYNQGEEPLKQAPTTLVHEEETKSPLIEEFSTQTETKTATETHVAETPKAEKSEKVENPAITRNNVVTEATSPIKEEKSAPVTEPLKVDPPAPIEDFENVDETGMTVKVPENTLAKASSEPEVTAVEIENNEGERHTFHYKFYNHKLYLYGDFKNIPYEIIELNTISGKSLYLYYKDSFYYLESNQMEVSPLQRIKDEKLVEELDSLRVNK